MQPGTKPERIQNNEESPQRVSSSWEMGKKGSDKRSKELGKQAQHGTRQKIMKKMQGTRQRNARNAVPLSHQSIW